MRLLKLSSSGELSITADLFDNIPPYAILSHTWGEDEDEVTFNDLRMGSGKDKAGYAKITFCGTQACKDGNEHFWIDTCCIDKASQNELSEAINSMFRWYQQSAKCYVYLPDVTTLKRDGAGQSTSTWAPLFRNSKWFTRGWTLQELLAPSSIEFFSRESERLGDKKSLCDLIHEITGISVKALRGAALSSFSVNERLAWRAKRNTKRPEDQVYCLLGIFDVHMMPLYGEGQRCWSRFKDELSKSFRYQLDETGEGPILATTSSADDTSGPTSDWRKEMFDSLAFSQMDTRRSTIKRAYSTTCAWFLKHDIYRAWTDTSEMSSHRGFLWINGKPGAAAPDLNDILAQFETAFRAQPHSFTWTVEILQALFSAAVIRLGKRRLRCFVDALDECNEQEIRDMIVFWEDLGQEALEKGSEIYTCFSSRHYPTIEIRYGLQLILEDEEGHGQDLVKYVSNHFRVGKGKFSDEVRREICDKANGVFMWAVLVVDILNREFSGGRIFAVKQRLQKIPQKLSDLFSEILRRDATNLDDLLLCLQWVLFAKRPLSREEFYFAMVSGLHMDHDNLGPWNPEHITTEDMERFVLNSSKGLAELTRGKVPTVQFIHESVRDFLLKDNGLVELWPQLGRDLSGQSHDHLKQCCLNYLRSNSSSCLEDDEPLPKASSNEGKILRDTLHASFPFLEYASRQILYHADKAAPAISQASFVADFEQTEFKALLRVLNAFSRYDSRRYTSRATLPYFLAESGFARLIELARESGVGLHTTGERYRCPLGAAMVNGHGNTIAAIMSLEAGAFLDEIDRLVELGRSFKDSKETSPLIHAIKTGDEPTCEFLLRSELFVPLETARDGRDCLSLAAERGFEQVVTQLLADPVVNLTSTSSTGRLPLSYAAQGGSVAVCGLFLDIGCNIHELDHKGRDTLSHAAEEGCDTVVQLLINHGATIDRADVLGRTALHYGAQNGHDATVKRLIDSGAIANPETRDGRTPLAYAVAAGHQAVTEVLIASDARFDREHSYVTTLLRDAAREGHLDVVKLLMARGAAALVDVRGAGAVLASATIGAHVEVVRFLSESFTDMINEHGSCKEVYEDALDSVLQQCTLWTIRTGYDSRVPFSSRLLEELELLLEKGASPNWYWQLYGFKEKITELHRASRDCHWRVVELLLNHGGDVALRDIQDQTSLHYAAKYGQIENVLRLLEHGADIDAQDYQGRTALISAIIHRRVQAVKALLDAGADANIEDDSGRPALHWCLRHLYQPYVYTDVAIRGPEVFASEVVAILQDLLAHGAGPLDRDYWAELDADFDQNPIMFLEYDLAVRLMFEQLREM